MCARLLRGNREVSALPWVATPGAARGRPEAEVRDARCGEVGLIQSTEEVGEQRGLCCGGADGGKGGTKGNADPQSTVRTQSRRAVSQARARIREAVNRNREEKLTALLHHVSVDCLRAGFLALKKRAAAGIDQVTWDRYAENLEENLRGLHRRVQIERIERCRRAGPTFRRRTASDGRSASPQSRTRSSRRRWL